MEGELAVVLSSQTTVETCQNTKIFNKWVALELTVKYDCKKKSTDNQLTSEIKL